MKNKQNTLLSSLKTRWNGWSEHWFAKSVLTTTLSIVLAFWADRWYEEARDQRQLSEALQNLYQEHQENTTEIDTALEQQAILLEILQKRRSDSTSTLMEIASQYPYIPQPSLKTTSLSRFLSNDALKYDFELLSLLASLDVQHANLQQHFLQMDGVLYAPATNELSRAGRLQKALMFNMVGSAVARERSLKEEYERLAQYLASQRIINLGNKN